MSASQRHPNQNEIDKCLQDAGVSDDLSFQEKLEFYNAIKVSQSFNKDTLVHHEIESDSDVEKENQNKEFFFPINALRRNKNNKQKSPETTTINSNRSYVIEDPLSDSFSEEEIKEKENADPEWQPTTSNNRQNKNLKRKLPSSSQLDNAKRKVNDILQKDINIFDRSISQHSSLTRIIIPLAYEKPFLYRKALDQMNFSDRLKAIYKYHFILLQRYKQALQKSRTFIKWGKPVLPSNKFNGSIDKRETSFDDGDGENEDGEVNFHLSQNNIRIVQNNTDVDEEKSDASKSASPSSLIQYTNGIDTTNEISRRENSSPIVEVSTEMDVDENQEPTAANSSPDFDILKDDLAYMNVSKNKKKFSGNSSRSETMFDNFVKEEQKRIEQWLEMDKFEQTLSVLSDEECSDFVSDKNSNRVMKKHYTGDDAFIVKETRKDENTPWRRRITPPNPIANKKKQGSNRKAVSGKKNDQIKPLPARLKQQVEDQKITTISRGKTSSEISKKECPICRQKFTGELIQEHVESCMESVESEDECELSAFTATIKCDVCDKVFEFNTDYEIHVNKCIQKYKEQ